MPTTVVSAGDGYDESAALARAMALSLQEAAYRAARTQQPQAQAQQQQARPAPAGDGAASPASQQLDADFALALSLQEQFDSGRATPEGTPSTSGRGAAGPVRLPAAHPVHRPPAPGASPPGPPAPGPGLPAAPRDEGGPVGFLRRLAGDLTGVCAGCGGALGLGGHVTALGSSWHHGCFKCAGCDQLLPAMASFTVRDERPYHAACSRELFHPKCDVCRQFLPHADDGSNSITWKEIRFWGIKYCHKHGADGTRKCHSCERLEAVDGPRYAALADGRAICLECCESIVVDTEDCQPLYTDILRWFADKALALPERPPLILVDVKALNDASRGRKHAHGEGGLTRGVCLAEHTRVREVVRVPAAAAAATTGRGPGGGAPGSPGALGGALGGLIGGVLGGFGGGGASSPGSRLTLTQSRWIEVERVTGSEVTAILILSGYPLLLSGSILAHEVMHAYFRLAHKKGRRFSTKLAPPVEEGICQLAAWLWLKDAIRGLAGAAGGGGHGHGEGAGASGASAGAAALAAGTAARRAVAFADFCCSSIESDRSPVYGDGFRAALGAYRRVGLASLLDHVEATGELPQP